jgi:transcriptional regulator with XRE-family HTH domain
MPNRLDMTIASRLQKAIGSESVASFAKRSGVGESLLRKYLAGSQPGAENLLKLADAAAVNVAWLIDGRQPQAMPIPDQPEGESGLLTESDSSESRLLVRYREASDLEKEAVEKLLDAIANPGGMAWYRVGEAISKIANIFPRKK